MLLITAVFVLLTFARALHLKYFVVGHNCSTTSVCVSRSLCICRNLSMNPMVAIESGAFIGLSNLERL